MFAESRIYLDLCALADPSYRDFESKLLPTVPPESILGVRMPHLRAYARKIKGTPEAACFLGALPHQSYDENNLHACLLSMMRDRTALIGALDAFLPYVDNWATCDSLRPVIFARKGDLLRPDIARWMADSHPYTCRFGIEMLMLHCLGDVFVQDDLRAVAEIAARRHDEYYVAMMCAWYFATALAVREEETRPYFADEYLHPTVRDMAIRKAIESRRVSEARKNELKKRP